MTLLAGGCSRGKTGSPLPPAPEVSISCIAVLPVNSPLEFSGEASKSQKKNMRNASEIFDKMLVERLINRNDIRFINSDQVQGLDSGSTTDSLSLARKIGSHLNCNAVLETKLLRFRDRVGGELSAKEPASVAFEYRLIELNKGQTLCHGAYDETQSSVLENLYNWNKAAKRGFKWVSGMALLEEGIQEKFSECKYLQDR